MSSLPRARHLVGASLTLLLAACTGYSELDVLPLTGDAGDVGSKDGGGTVEPTCGDGTCAQTESCSNCPGDCGVCNLACTGEGARSCGGNGNPGNPNVLYLCQGGTLKVDKDCGRPCETGQGGSADQCPPDAPVCGDGKCVIGETCTNCAKDCGACLTCGSEGGHYCGGNTVGGNANILYICKGGILEVEKDCGKPCEAMPPGVPDQCPAPPGTVTVPASLTAALSRKPYTEGTCTATTHPRWPYEAMSCSYTASGVSARVVSANPTPDRVGRWIVDAATLIPALQALKGTAQAEYERGLRGMAQFIIGQSGRIFPIEGIVVEVGICSNGGRCNFDRGVSSPCDTGCYCRINSLHRTTWCKYQESRGKQSYSACLGTFGSRGYTEAWGNHCMENHIQSWNSDTNEHFRAAAYAHNLTIATRCPPGKCTPAQVADLVTDRYVNINPTF